MPAQDAMSRQSSLMVALPSTFEELVNRYWNLLEAVSGQEATTQGFNMSADLDAKGTQLGSLNIGAGDVVAIHTEAFKRTIRDAEPQQAQAYMRTGSLMVIELLSRLVSFYQSPVTN